MKIFLIGDRGIGKSTVIKKIIPDLNYKIGGFFTKKNGDYIDFCEINGNKLFSFYWQEDPQKIGRLFDSYGVEVLLEGFIKSELIIMDELGFLEREAKKFQQAVFNIINSEKHILGVLKNYKKNIFYDTLKNNKALKIFEITMDNRNSMPKEIIKLYE